MYAFSFVEINEKRMWGAKGQKKKKKKKKKAIYETEYFPLYECSQDHAIPNGILALVRL